MDSLERVMATIKHKEPDSVPLNIWNFRKMVRWINSTNDLALIFCNRSQILW